MEIIHKIEETFGVKFPIRLYEVKAREVADLTVHSHEYMQIWYVNSGSCTHIVENKSYRLPPKSLLILPPFVKHSFEDASDDLCFIGCEFPLEIITEDNIMSTRRGHHLLEFSYMEIFETAVCSTKACYIPSLSCQVVIEKILFEMLEELHKREPFFEVVLKANLLQFLAQLARDYESNYEKSKISLDYKNYIETALVYIDMHYYERLYIRDIARVVAMSESYFSYFFKNVTGYTFVDYLNQVRVKKAEDLLQNSLLPVVEISDGVGFSDNAYFNRVFKKYTGISPALFRKQKSENNTK